jgi:hypothetical protein
MWKHYEITIGKKYKNLYKLKKKMEIFGQIKGDMLRGKNMFGGPKYAT